MEYLNCTLVLVVLAAPIMFVRLRQAHFVREAGHAAQPRGAAVGELKQVELRAFAK